MIRTTLVAAALAGGFALAGPAHAAPLAQGAAGVAAAGTTNLVEQVQYRRYYGPRRYGYYGPRYYRYNRGAAVGAGIAAGALGALAAGALLAPGPVYAEPAPPPVYVAPDADAIAYCSRRFRTYDPATGTYIASGGIVRSCP
jgi:hypothetical protein